MTEIVHYEFSDQTSVIRMDDGRVNAVSDKLIIELNAALDRAEEDGAKAIALVGRDGKFSAGFDLSVMNMGPKEAAALVKNGANLMIRMYSLPISLVFGVTGHAVAMGALFTLVADEVIGAEGDFKIGLNEVAIGMAMPEFGVEVAKQKLSPSSIRRAISNAELFNSEDAVKVGYLDYLLPLDSVADAAVARAKEMAATLNPRALALTKQRLHQSNIEALKKILEKDIGL